MPLCRAIKGKKYQGIWEVRTNLSNARISRVFFCPYDNCLVLLHGFIKKSQKTPTKELDVALKRMRGLKND